MYRIVPYRTQLPRSRARSPCVRPICHNITSYPALISKNYRCAIRVPALLNTDCSCIPPAHALPNRSSPWFPCATRLLVQIRRGDVHYYRSINTDSWVGARFSDQAGVCSLTFDAEDDGSRLELSIGEILGEVERESLVRPHGGVGASALPCAVLRIVRRPEMVSVVFRTLIAAFVTGWFRSSGLLFRLGRPRC